MLHGLFVDDGGTAALDLLFRRHHHFLDREHPLEAVQQRLLGTVQCQTIRPRLRLKTDQ